MEGPEDRTTCWYQNDVIEEMNNFYDKHKNNEEVRTHFPIFQKLLKQVNSNGKLLDLGCGTAMLSEFCLDFDYYGADLPHIVAGCAFRNYPSKKYTSCDIMRDNLFWIANSDYKVIVVNGVVDIMEAPLEVLDKLLANTPEYLLIHRQEITEKGKTHTIKNPSYGGTTFHSVISREDFVNMAQKHNFEIVSELNCSFANWENGGSSFLLKKKPSQK